MQNKDAKKYHILVIEDNEGDYILVEDYLYEMFLAPKIVRAKSFRETFAILTAKPFTIDTVLLDLTLPDKQGEALINEIVALCPATPIVILTGYTDVTFAVKALSLGASDYLLKDSLNPTTLYKSIVYNLERKKTLVSLRESEQRYADLFHLSPQPMWVYDCNTEYFLDVNNAAIEQYGYTYDEFLTMTVVNLLPTKLEADDINESNGISAGAPIYDEKVRYKKKNGQVIYVNLQSNLIKYKGIDAQLVLANDISKNIEYIKAIENQNSRLRDIAWTQSHIVRAPLARIMGLIYVLEGNIVDDDDRNDCLKHIQTSAYELDEVIRNIVDKAKHEEIN